MILATRIIIDIKLFVKALRAIKRSSEVLSIRTLGRVTSDPVRGNRFCFMITRQMFTGILFCVRMEKEKR